MMIGKPTDVGTPQAASRTGAARAVEAGSSGGKVEKVESVEGIDSVKLSDVGRAIVGAGQTLEEFRAEKVAALKKAVEDGSYKVQAKVVADRMINEAAGLLETMAASGD
jgi:negative regulator of flagellin synthesis FlgM